MKNLLAFLLALIMLAAPVLAWADHAGRARPGLGRR